MKSLRMQLVKISEMLDVCVYIQKYTGVTGGVGKSSATDCLDMKKVG
jgi:hypothetical protein